MERMEEEGRGRWGGEEKGGMTKEERREDGERRERKGRGEE